MKVVCITHQNFTRFPFDPNVPKPDIGEEVTIIGEKEYKGVDCYILEEYKSPFHPIFNYLYDKRNFAPLTGLDETTLVNEEWEEKYCVPVNS